MANAMHKIPCDYSKLRGLIIEKYGSLSKFSEELHVKQPDLSRKLSGVIGFTQKDVFFICEKLGLNKEDIGEYFFSRKC